MEDKTVTVTMQSPNREFDAEGKELPRETREVDHNGPDLVPLMVQGWTQLHHGKEVEFPGAAPLEPANPGDENMLGVSEVK